MQKLVIGCGYLGQRVARKWQGHGDSVTALTRSPERAAQFSQIGITPVIGDVTDRATLQNLPEVQTVLYSVGFDRRADQARQAVTVAGLQNALQQLKQMAQPTQPRLLIYISTISVYGQTHGEWVDETSQAEPTRENGLLALQAEQAVQEFGERHSNWNIWVLRLAGIYGPGRLLARIENLKAGEPLSGNPAAWLNLIHVDDAAAAITACESKPRQFDTLLVCDDQPVAREDFYGELAKRIGAPQPTYAENNKRREDFYRAYLQSAPRSRISGMNKRCCNRKLHEQLEYTLLYPNYQLGLAQVLNQTGEL